MFIALFINSLHVVIVKGREVHQGTVGSGGQ